MTGPDIDDERNETDAAAKAEAASAGALLQALVKAVRGFVIYLPNNPLHEKYFADLWQRTGEHLEEHGDLHLAIEHDGMRCRGVLVYTNPELRENIAFRMYADGIRSLSFLEGVEEREMRAFVEIAGLPSPEDAEDDVATRLWTADLPHVRYVLADLPTPSGAQALGVRPPRVSQETAIRRFASGLPAAPPATPPPLVSHLVFTIAEAELRALQQQVAAEEERAPIEDVQGILAAILAVEADTALFTELVDILARLCGELLLSGAAASAVTLVGVINRTAALPTLPPAHAAALEAARARVLSGEVLEAFGRQMAQGKGAGRDELRSLVAALGSSAVGPFCRILGEVAGKEVRRVLVDALAEAARETPAQLLPFLQDERWYLVRNTIYILRRIASPLASGAVRRCVGHRDPRVRKEVLLYFDEVPDPAADAVALRLLDDEVPALRSAAARSLARHRSKVGADRLLAVTAQGAFGERELGEREAVWESIAELAPDRALPLLREMLLRRRWFGQAKELDDAACAAAALRRLGTPPALALLREAAAAKRGRAREIVEEALRSATRAGSRGTTPAEDPDHD